MKKILIGILISHGKILLMTGACAIIIGFLFSFPYFSHKSDMQIGIDLDGSQTADIITGYEISGVGVFKEFKANLTGIPQHHHLQVNPDEGFIIKINFTIDSVKDPFGDEISQETLSHILPDFINYLQKHLRVQLSVPEIEYEPKGFVPISTDLSVTWAVKAYSIGNFIGNIGVAFDHHYGRLEKGRAFSLYDLNWDSNIIIELMVSESKMKLTHILGLLSSLIGLLVTVTTLISYFWLWRDFRGRQVIHKEYFSP